MPFEGEFLKAVQKTERIEFEGGAWVEIRVEETIGDSCAGVDAMAGLRYDLRHLAAAAESGEPGDIKLSVGAFKLDTLQRRIVAWSSSDPVEAKNIAQMPKEMADRILERIDELSRGRSADQKKASTTSASPTLSRAERRRGRAS